MKLKLLMDDIEKDGFFGPILRGTLSAASYHIFPSVWFCTMAPASPLVPSLHILQLNRDTLALKIPRLQLIIILRSVEGYFYNSFSENKVKK
jgi:hypothetical protein